MKALVRNKQKFYYALFVSTETVQDEYGNETGEQPAVYSEPVEMWANISPATGQSNTEMFGNLDNYDKVIVTDDLECPIDEHSVLFIDQEPEHNMDGKLMYDYIVKRVAKSLNSVSIAVSKVKVS